LFCDDQIQRVSDFYILFFPFYLGFLKKALNLNDNEYSGIEIAVNSQDEVEKVSTLLKPIFGNAYKILNRYQQNQSLYAVMNLEKWIFYAVLCIILIVAAFNMVGALTMLVLEKQKDISVLNALGANQNLILKIFLSEGFLLAIFGGGLGMIIALVLVLLQEHFHLVPLTGGSFLIDYFWFPALKASKQEFSLRSE